MTGRKRKTHDFNSINRIMNYKPDYSNKKLVCITNGKEVLRITRENAKEYFYSKITADENMLKVKQMKGYEVNFDLGYYYEKSIEWFYTTKSIYKQYQESLKPDSKIPMPLFHQTIKTIDKDAIEKEQIVQTHVFLNY